MQEHDYGTVGRVGSLQRSTARLAHPLPLMRVGNAQMLSRVGIAMGSVGGDQLKIVKQEWLDGTHLQPLRRLVDEIMVVDDWAEALLAVDMIDSFVYPLVYGGLDDAALLTGAGAYSLSAQHLTGWFADQRRWLDALVTARVRRLSRPQQSHLVSSAQDLGTEAGGLSEAPPRAGRVRQILLQIRRTYRLSLKLAPVSIPGLAPARQLSRSRRRRTKSMPSSSISSITYGCPWGSSVNARSHRPPVTSMCKVWSNSSPGRRP